jgi:HAMP domain-containing protein
MWTALQATAAGAPLPASLAEAMVAAKSAYFDPQYLTLRDRLLGALLSGEKPEMTANQWSPFTVGRMASAVNVAERALEAAREHTSAQHGFALRSLLMQLALLVAVIVLSCAVMLAIRRRVIIPLHTLRDAMLQVSSGDLSVDTDMLSARTRLARWPALSRLSSGRPRTSCGSRRRSMSAILALPSVNRRLRLSSSDSRAGYARPCRNSAMHRAKCEARPAT